MSSEYIKGEKIKDPMTAINLIVKGSPVFVGCKCQNSGWMSNQYISTIVRQVNRDVIYFAIKQEKSL